MISSSVEEMLERLYLSETEPGEYPPEDSAEVCGEAASSGLVQQAAEGYRLTASGRQAGRNVVRRHRLAERLLNDVLATRGRGVEEDACRFEHILGHGLDDRICVLLGHPRTCPHGKQIPEGDCCRRARTELIREVSPLCDGTPGAAGVVAYLSTRDSKEVQKMMAMGLLPGIGIRLIRCFPCYVFQVGYSQFTVDRPLAEAIYIHWDTRGI